MFLNIARTILSLLYMFFLPGYIFTHLILRNKLNRAETLVASIGLSICITICSGMIVHFTEMKIDYLSIITSVSIVTLILAFLVFLKDIRNSKTIRWKSSNFKQNKFFTFSLILLICVMIVIIYFSITFPSKEEFIEIYWKLTGINGLQNITDINCSIDRCSVSGIYKSGNVDLLDNSYDTIITDLYWEESYDFICIDLNQNELFCEENEGPFKAGNSFNISSNHFNIIYSKGEEFYIFNFPKETDISNFTVGFSMKSNYKEVKLFNVGLFVNETLQYTKSIVLYPDREVSKYYSVNIPEDGISKVRIAVLPITFEDRAYIEFWIEKTSIQ